MVEFKKINPDKKKCKKFFSELRRYETVIKYQKKWIKVCVAYSQGKAGKRK